MAEFEESGVAAEAAKLPVADGEGVGPGQKVAEDLKIPRTL